MVMRSDLLSEFKPGIICTSWEIDIMVMSQVTFV
jgi:hypothetical protein